MIRYLGSLLILFSCALAPTARADDGEDEQAEPSPDGGAPAPEPDEEEPPPWRVERIDDDTEDRARNDYDVTFRIRRARAKLDWRPNNRIKGRVQIGIEKVDESPSTLLRDAYFDITPRRRLMLRAGLFKKPFSGLELRSPARTRVMRRGSGNGLIIGDLLYGDRDLGMQLRYRLLDSMKLDTIIGVFNGSGPEMDFGAPSKDVAGRVELKPWSFLTLGVNGSFKFFSDEDIPVGHTFAGGADARFKIEGFTFLLEGLRAENHLAFIDNDKLEDAPTILNGVAYLSYRQLFSRAHKLALEPMFKFEVLDPKLSKYENEVLSYTPGVMLHLGRAMRLVVYAVFRDPGRRSAKKYPAKETIMLQARFFP